MQLSSKIQPRVAARGSRQARAVPCIQCPGATPPCVPRPAQTASPSCAVHAASDREGVVARVALAEAPAAPSRQQQSGVRPLKVIVAGAGIGGLVLALALIKRGVHVEVYERDLTAIRGEGKYRGPIQVQSNALAALEAIDEEVGARVLEAGCITGDRINGLCDGVSGDWYCKFDTFHPAVDRGLPVTRVVSRVTLQRILAERVLELGGPATITGNSHVIGFEEGTNAATGEPMVTVRMEDGRTVTGDLLVGADGIWSKIRTAVVGETRANYSGYTCYTGISDFTPPDIDIVGYRVFLGNGQYFVSSDVGGGRMQWYGFHKEAAGGADEPGQRKARLLSIFGHWNDAVVDLIKATPEDDVLRRDIYDRPPVFRWSRGRVALLGDSAHAMQPNLGQGGCMAMEDAFTLAADLADAVDQAGGVPGAVDVPSVLRGYHTSRNVRVSSIHGMAGMAAFMAATYKAYLGEGLGPLSWLTTLKIPHPGRVGGRVALNLTMPAVLQWVLGGNVGSIEAARVGRCLLSDKPKAFTEAEFARFMWDDDALVRAAHADWMLLAERPSTQPGADATSTTEAKGVYITDAPVTVGRCPLAPGAAAAAAAAASEEGGAGAAPAADLVVDDVAASPQHARVWRSPDDNTYHLQALGGSSGTWHNGRRLGEGEAVRLMPGDALEFGRHPSHEAFRVKLQHVSLRHDRISGARYSTIVLGRRDGEEGAGQAAAPAAEMVAA